MYTVKPVYRGHLNTVKPVFRGHFNIPQKVSLHDRCPFVTGSLTLGGGLEPFSDQVSPYRRVAFEDRFYCMHIEA